MNNSKKMKVSRLHLKPKPQNNATPEEVLQFCEKEKIIGLGWGNVKSYASSEDELKKDINNSEIKKGDYTRIFKTLNCIRKQETGDLIWTRTDNGSDYYLCRVGETLWQNRKIEPKHEEYDVSNFVSAEWVHVGSEDMVPGKVVNSFIPALTMQGVREVNEVSKYIWNLNCKDERLKYNDVGSYSFWDCIGSEDLECLVLMYLQYIGFYIVSTTLKRGTGKIEAVLLSHDGKKKCYPQVKRVTEIKAEEYVQFVKPDTDDIVYLFTTSEKYGKIDPYNHNIVPLYKRDIETFIREHPELMPNNVKYWLKLTNFQ